MDDSGVSCGPRPAARAASETAQAGVRATSKQVQLLKQQRRMIRGEAL